MEKKRLLEMFLVIFMSFAVIGTATILGVNAHVKNIGGNHIITAEEAAKLNDVDCIVVLGCLVKDNGIPSDML